MRSQLIQSFHQMVDTYREFYFEVGLFSLDKLQKLDEPHCCHFECSKRDFRGSAHTEELVFLISKIV